MKIKSPLTYLFFFLGFSFLAHPQSCLAEEARPPLFYYFENLEQDFALEHSFVVHMMFFPWDKEQKLLSDELQFDHTPYINMLKRVENIPNGRVVMWTWSKMESFCLLYYPEIWTTLKLSTTRPIMFVDILRWLVVYHFGGIYWQYCSLPLSSSMSDYLLFENSLKKIKLFTEAIITEEFSQKMADQPIRKGQPEELIRVVTGAFSSLDRKNPALLDIVNFLLERLKTEKALVDYDILYITGNAAISTYYDLYGQFNEEIELVSLEKTKKLIAWNSQGSWRLDKVKPKKPDSKPEKSKKKPKKDLKKAPKKQLMG